MKSAFEIKQWRGYKDNKILVNDASMKLIKIKQSEHVIINGQILKAQAEEFAHILGHSIFVVLMVGSTN